MVFFAWFVQAQSVLVVSDAETGLPVEGAVAFVQSKGRVHSFVTDSSGELQMNASERAVITVRHLYYNTFTDTLQLTARVPIHLVPAKVALNEVVVTGQYQPNSALNSQVSLHPPA